MKRQWTVMEPPALFLSNENNFQHQKQLVNFTKSVVDLETEICHTSKSSLNEIIVQERSTPQTLPMPQGTDTLVFEEQHANLKDGNFEECTEEFVRQHFVYSPIKQLFSTGSKRNEQLSPNGQKQTINGATVFSDDENGCNALWNIQLSRVYFSQQSVNGSQAFQEAQNAGFQPVSETPSGIEKTNFKKKKVQFKEPVEQRRSMIFEAKNLNRPNTTTDINRNIKGLFQKSSNLPKNAHSTKRFADKYVYFLTDKHQSEQCTGLNRMQQDDEDWSNSQKRTSGAREAENASSGEEHNTPEMQVVVDGDGRVHVVHGSQKNEPTEAVSNTQVQPESSAQRFAVIDNPEMHRICNTDPYCQAPIVPAHVRELHSGQKKHVCAKITIDGSYSAINNNSCLQNMDQSENFNSRRISLHEQQVRVHGNEVIMVRQAKTRTENRHSSYDIPANYELHEYDSQCGYRRQYEPQPMTNTHTASYPSGDIIFSRDRAAPRIVRNAVGNRQTFINCHANSEQTLENCAQTAQKCFQSKRHRVIPARSCLDNDKQSSITSETSPDHSYTPQQRARPKTRSQRANQAHGKASRVEHVNKDQSRNDRDTVHKDSADLICDEDRRYRCDWPACTKAFRHYSFLVLHRRIHTGERPYICTWMGCGKQFRRSDDYQRHYRVHTGVKPYPCSVCGKAFKRSDHRLFHYRAIHGMYKQ